MHPPTLYLDTSVIGGYFDEAFMADTRALWRLHDAGTFRFACSQLVIQEIILAPASIRELVRTSFNPETLWPVTVEARQLAAHYMAHEVVTAKYADDALHVALCVIGRADYLVSWNFKHLANVRREAGFNAVNILQGYPQVRIVPPTFLIHGHEEKDV